MKDKLYKRKQVQWFDIVSNSDNFDLCDNLDSFIKAHPKMSLNRCAYNVLKTYYSTTFGSDLAKWCLDMARHYESVDGYKRVLNAKWC